MVKRGIKDFDDDTPILTDPEESGKRSKLNGEGGTAEDSEGDQSGLQKHMYLVWSTVASLLMALTSYLRTLVATTPYSTFFTLSFSYLLMALASLSVGKVKDGRNFLMPWTRVVSEPAGQERENPENESTRRVFSKLQCLMLFLGGMGEFGISLMMVLAFNKADEFGINAGVAGVLTPFSSFLVSIISYCLYKEGLQVSQIVGMVVILLGVTFIALFPAQVEDESEDDATVGQVVFVLALSLFATFFLTLEIMMSKCLQKRKVAGDYLGASFLLFEGLAGSLCLLGSVGLQDFHMSAHDFWFAMLAGVCGFVAISLLQYSVATGVAGIALSIFNMNAAFFTAMCYFFLD